MPFDEALERFAGVDPKEMQANIDKEKRRNRRRPKPPAALLFIYATNVNGTTFELKRRRGNRLQWPTDAFKAPVTLRRKRASQAASQEAAPCLRADDCEAGGGHRVAYRKRSCCLKSRYDILNSIKGIGFVGAATLAGCLHELGQLPAAKTAALAGVVPFNALRGEWPRHRKAGHAHVKASALQRLGCGHQAPLVRERLLNAGAPHDKNSAYRGVEG